MHKYDFQCSAPRRSPPYPFVWLIGADRFDESNRANRDQIILFGWVCVIFFDDVRNQSKIMLDQLIACRSVTLCHAGQTVLFFIGAQRRRKRTARTLNADMKNSATI